MVSKAQEEKILKETKLLVRLFLQTNASDIELGKMTGISSSTVGRRLTNKERILKAIPEKGEKAFELISKKRKFNLMQGKLIGGQISMMNSFRKYDNSFNEDRFPKLKLEVLSKSLKERLKLLVHIVLTFKVKLEILSRLFQIPEDVLFEEMKSVSNESSIRALEYLFSDSNVYDQDMALNNILNFYNSYLDMMKKDDVNNKELLLGQIDDRKMKELRDQRSDGGPLTDDVIKVVINYQLKYALTNDEAASTAKISTSNYARRVKAFIQDDAELRRHLELVELYRGISRK